MHMLPKPTWVFRVGVGFTGGVPDSTYTPVTQLTYISPGPPSARWICSGSLGPAV